MQASLFVKLTLFKVVQIFFVSAVSGSIFDQLRELSETPAPVRPGPPAHFPDIRSYRLYQSPSQTSVILPDPRSRVRPSLPPVSLKLSPLKAQPALLICSHTLDPIQNNIVAQLCRLSSSASVRPHPIHSRAAAGHCGHPGQQAAGAVGLLHAAHARPLLRRPGPRARPRRPVRHRGGAARGGAWPHAQGARRAVDHGGWA